MVSSRSAALVPVEHIARSILVLRGQKVLLDAELAALYGVTTKRLNEQVKRNAEPFPEDFLFRLGSDEVEALNRSHFATGSQKHRDPENSGALICECTLSEYRYWQRFGDRRQHRQWSRHKGRYGNHRNPEWNKRRSRRRHPIIPSVEWSARNRKGAARHSARSDRPRHSPACRGGSRRA